MEHTNKKGITLLELVVVMLIIAIGAVLLVPNIGAWLPNYRLRSATRDVVSTLRTAQIKAVSTNMDYQVSFNPGAGSYILQRNSGGVWLDEGSIQRLPSGIMMNTNFTNNNAIFRTNSTASGGSVFVQNTKGTQRRITVLFVTGRIHVEPPL